MASQCYPCHVTHSAVCRCRIEQGKPKDTERPKANMEIRLHGLWGEGQPGLIAPEIKTAKGFAAVSLAVLRSLSGARGGREPDHLNWRSSNSNSNDSMF